MPLNIVAISRLNELPRNTRGVYIIIRNTEVTYIGQSMACVLGRIRNNVKALETATHAAWHECGVSHQAKSIEEQLILFWHPEFNRQGKSTQPPWEVYWHPTITRKPDFLEEYAKAVVAQYTEMQEKHSKAISEIAYYDQCYRELTIKNEELTKKNRQRAYQNTVLNKRLAYLRAEKCQPSKHSPEYPYIGGVVLSRPEPLFLWHSPRQKQEDPSNFVFPPLLPIWVPGHGQTHYPKPSRVRRIWQRVRKTISHALFGLI